jgi:hypothetical protein
MKYSQPYEDRYQTPLWACNIMADMIPEGVKTVLEPTPGEGRLVNVLQKRGYEVTAPPLFEELDPFLQFDAVVMNPPFLNSIEQKFLLASLQITPIVIALLPWFSLINSDSRSYLLKTFGIRSVTHLPRCTFRQIRVQTMIIHLQRGWDEPTIFEIIDSSFVKKMKNQ